MNKYLLLKHFSELLKRKQENQQLPLVFDVLVLWTFTKTLLNLQTTRAYSYFLIAWLIVTVLHSSIVFIVLARGLASPPEPSSGEHAQSSRSITIGKGGYVLLLLLLFEVLLFSIEKSKTEKIIYVVNESATNNCVVILALPDTISWIIYLCGANK